MTGLLDIMDRHVDQEAQDFLSHYRDVLAKNKGTFNYHLILQMVITY